MIEFVGTFILFTTLVSITWMHVFRQDYLYSQFLNLSAYLIPSLSGQFESNFRMYIIPGNKPNDFNAAVDHNILKGGADIGLIFTREMTIQKFGDSYLCYNFYQAI